MTGFAGLGWVHGPAPTTRTSRHQQRRQQPTNNVKSTQTVFRLPQTFDDAGWFLTFSESLCRIDWLQQHGFRTAGHGEGVVIGLTKVFLVGEFPVLEIQKSGAANWELARPGRPCSPRIWEAVGVRSHEPQGHVAIIRFPRSLAL